MDDLNHRVDEGFSETRTELRALRGEVNSRFDAADAKFAAQNRMMIQLFGGMFATMTVGFLGVIATVITQT